MLCELLHVVDNYCAIFCAVGSVDFRMLLPDFSNCVVYSRVNSRIVNRIQHALSCMYYCCMIFFNQRTRFLKCKREITQYNIHCYLASFDYRILAISLFQLLVRCAEERADRFYCFYWCFHSVIVGFSKQ